MRTDFVYLTVAAALLGRCMLAVPASAAGQGLRRSDGDYYRIGKESVSVTATVPDSGISVRPPYEQLNPDKQMAAALGIINAGVTAWKVICKGAPSAEAQASYASAIPPDRVQEGWSSVAAWTGPKVYLYTYTVTNRMGIDVVKVSYEISFYYGGKLAAGSSGAAGSYIANFTVKPVDVRIKWGWHFDLEVGVSHPMNTGSVSEPVAFLMADLKWRVYTTIDKDGKVGIWSYSVDGKGNFSDLTAQQKDLTKQIPPIDASPLNHEFFWN